MVTYAHYIDVDKLAHGVYAPDSAANKQIGKVFGQELILKDGTVDRKALGDIVFADSDEMSVSSDDMQTAVVGYGIVHIEDTDVGQFSSVQLIP